MELQINDYQIETFDKQNFALYHIREKTQSHLTKKEGDIKILIGYYGNLGGALKRLLNEAILSAEEVFTLNELLEAIREAEAKLNERFKSVKPKDYKAGAML